MIRSELFETRTFTIDAAERIRSAMNAALAARGECVIGLCGGSTPAPVYAALAASGLPWERILFTFGDERCVGPDDPQSNYGMAQRAWFEPAGVPGDRVLRMRGELAPEAAAADYATQLETHARRLGHPDGRLVHDVLLLGMGDDGHTASLFPGTAALEETGRDVVANFVPKFDAWRLTLTYPALNRSRAVFFLVNDLAKRPVVDAIRAGGSGYPAEGIRPAAGGLTWIVGG
jgi:6-phosphogluconolactonase